MCGRFAELGKREKIAAALGVPLSQVPDHAPRYNIPPTHPVFGARMEGARRVADVFTWGLVPSWAKDPSIGARLINARAETLAEKPSYRGPFKNSRCLIAADGFYEWRAAGRGSKQPFFIRRRDREPFTFGGLWSHWTGHDGSEVLSCTIITTSPNDLMRPIHDRMPVIIPRGSQEEWLDHRTFDTERLSRLLAPLASGELEAFAVSTAVNAPAHDAPDCVEPIAV